MNEQYLLEGYELAESVETDIQHFFDVMSGLKQHLKTIKHQQEMAAKTNRPCSIYAAHHLERADEFNNARAIIQMDLQVAHVQVTERLTEQLQQRLSTIQQKMQDSKLELQHLQKQRVQNQAYYKECVLEDNDEAMNTSEDLAAQIDRDISRHTIKVKGHAGAADELETQIAIYQSITSAARRSLLRQKAIVSIESYKTAVVDFVQHFDAVSAYMALTDGIPLSDQAIDPIQFLKKSTLSASKSAGDHNPDYDDYKRSLLEAIDHEVETATR